MSSPQTPPRSPPAADPADTPTAAPAEVTYPLTETLLPLIEEIDNLPPFSSPFPTRHPITKLRLIPFHATSSDFKRKVPPMGLVPANVIPELQGIKGLSLSTMIVRADGGSHPSGGMTPTRQEEEKQGEGQLASCEGQFEVLTPPSGKKDHFVSSRPKDGPTSPSKEPSGAMSPSAPPVPSASSRSAPFASVCQGVPGSKPKAVGPSKAMTKVVRSRGKKDFQIKIGRKQGTPKPQPDMKGLTMQKTPKGKVRYQGIVLCVSFTDEVNAGGYQARTELMQGLARKWKEEGKFPDATKRWCDEALPVYCSPHSAIWSSKQFVPEQHAQKEDQDQAQSQVQRPFGNVAFEFERPMMQVLGFTPFGTHLTAYEGEGDEMKLWISRRSATRSDWPSKLDSTVAGGMPVGVTPLQNIIIECSEEAGWPEEMVRKHARCTGMVSFYKCLKTNFVVPGIEYTYDMHLPPGRYVPPRPDHKEADEFILMPVQEVLTALRNHKFKPLSAAITIDFLIRHGHITPENEVNYFEIVRRCHRSTGLAGPGI
ncbi:hypothetical protein IAU59_001079 [Kwoniella sp. CBS 9459]